MGGRPTAERFPVVLMFWRADCAPCRLELGDLEAMRRAAAPVRLQLVGLQPAAELRVGLRAANLADDASDVAVQDAAGVLTSWGGAPPRLPLAVAVDAEGAVCARHTGLIGRDRLAAWAKACGGAHARR